MSASLSFQIVAILVLGVLAQVVAWRVRLPSILLLLATGTVAGPVTGWLHPDDLMGDLLLPIVSLSVAVILYEGGLSLRIGELRSIGLTFVMLASVGVCVSWSITAVAGRYVLQLPWPVAVLLGAILVVTGPTVIGPMMRHLRLRGKVSALLKWEGIVVDSLGAMLAVSTFALTHAAALHEKIGAAAFDLGLTLAAGAVAGALAAALLIVSIARFWVPDSLHNPLSLTLMFSAFAAANALQQEAGLVAVTLMGIIVANQPWVAVRHVAEFKETLTVLLISCLFIVLSARLTSDDLRGFDWRSVVFVATLIVVARPLAVLASTCRSVLSWQEKCFLCCMAPRGIVAAAVSSVLALELVAAGYPEAVEIVPVTFLVVFSTVLLYGVVARPLALRLALVQANPQGVLFVGAGPWVRALAQALYESGCPVFLVDTDWKNIRRCRELGLPVLHGSALSQRVREEIDYAGLGRLLAVTPNEEVNVLACLHFVEDFGRQECYQLPAAATRVGKHEPVSNDLRGRLLFGKQFTPAAISTFAGPEPIAKKTKLTEDFDFQAYCAQHGDTVLPLFVLRTNGTVVVRTDAGFPELKPGDTIISLVASEGWFNVAT